MSFLVQTAAWTSRRLFSNGVSRRVHSRAWTPKQGTSAKAWFLGAAVALPTALLLKPSVHLDSEVIPEPGTDGQTFTDAATGITFPTTLVVPAKIKIPPLTLVGVGVRTVSFLGIKVYSVGFYADLGNPNLKIPMDMATGDKIAHIIKNSACVIRIVPTRSTSYTHLRDAFMRSLQARMVLGRQRGDISEDVEAEAGSPMRKLKSLFPNSPLTKHTPFDIFLTPPTPGKPRALIFRDMGAIENDWVATELMLAYFEGDGPSPALKKAVVERLATFEK